MDALEFLKEERRMCNSFDIGCVILDVALFPKKRMKSLREKLPSLSKTRQSVFLEQFPNVRFDINGIIDISPCQVDQKQYPLNGKDRCRFQSCFDCRREFWMQEVEE